MPERTAVLEGRGLVRLYAPRGMVTDRSRDRFAAVDGVSIELRHGEAYGLLGRSGAGKSTLARLLAGLEKPDAGKIHVDGVALDSAPGRRRQELRRRVQLVFQDPGAALDPRQTVMRAVAEPLAIHTSLDDAGKAGRVAELLTAVGLDAGRDVLLRLPHELSGGERQRVVMARALACDPAVLLLDEPVSALDASVRGQVLNLLEELREKLDLTMMLISHDVHVVAGTCSRVGMMLAGRIVEEGPAAEVLRRPRHPYTATLVAVAAGTGHGEGGDENEVGGSWAEGCAYRRVCPAAEEVCGQAPSARSEGAAHWFACHNPHHG